MSAEPPPPIDAVVMWVDGDDPHHRAKREQALLAQGIHSHATAATRFRSVGEVDWCLRSLLRFAPFLRHIHVVTDDQVPPLMRAPEALPAAWRDKLRRVDHREVFAGFEDSLPTFSSRSIAAVMHRIPGLAEWHICLNDDVMLLRDVHPDDWFRNGLPVQRGRFVRQPHLRWSRRLRSAWRTLSGHTAPPRAGLNDAQALAARMAGFQGRYLALAHVPFPLRRSTLEKYFEAHPQALRDQVAHRWRHPSQFEPVALSFHLEMKAGRAIVEPDAQLLYLNPRRFSARRLRRRLRRAQDDPSLIFACFQSLDAATPQHQQIVLDWMSQRLAA